MEDCLCRARSSGFCNMDHAQMLRLTTESCSRTDGCVWHLVASAEGRSTAQGRKLKGATAGIPVSGGPADSVVRERNFACSVLKQAECRYQRRVEVHAGNLQH